MESRIDIGTISLEGSPALHERADAAANRKLILAAAKELFAEHGVDAVSMADIAAKAGVGKGTLYRRFENKAELSLALMDEEMRDHQNEILASLREQSATGVPHLQQLAYFLDILVHFTEEHLPFLCEVQRAGLLGTSPHLEMPHIWRHMTISGLLHGARQSGELSADLDIEYTADALLAPLHADLFRFQREGRGFSPERISAGIQSLAYALGNL